MKCNGIVRKVDLLGRVTLPVEMRRSLGIELKDEVEIIPKGNQLIIHKPMADCVCAHCGKDNADGRRIVKIGKECICIKCIREAEREA